MMEEMNESVRCWMYYSVLVVIIPLILTIGFTYIVKDGDMKLTEYVDDIILIVFSVSCNLLALCCDKSKKIGYKVRGIFKDCALFVLVLSWSFYMLVTLRNIKITYKGWLIVFCGIFVLVCTAIGVLICGKHDKLEREFKKKKIGNCFTLFERVSKEEYKEIFEILKGNTCCESPYYDRIMENLDKKDK